MKTVQEFSSGGIVLEDGRVLMIQVRDIGGSELWTFPKGGVENGESPEEAALREVGEETGYEARIVAPLGEIRYQYRWKGSIHKKRVAWFLMKPMSKKQNHDDEVLGAEWVEVEKAKTIAGYPSDRKLLQEAMAVKTDDA